MVVFALSGDCGRGIGVLLSGRQPALAPKTDPAGRRLFIGGLQGPAGAHCPELIRNATRACDGLRPKDAVMEAVLAFAQALGAHRIVAVSQSNHVGRERYTARRIHADYDGFWMEWGGSALPCGNVALPVVQPVRDLSEVPSKKRSAYRRKLERAASVRAVVQQWLRPAAGPDAEPVEAMPLPALAANPGGLGL